MERLPEEAFEIARAPWPDLQLTLEQFTHHIAGLERAFESLHLSDLYLACACALGVPRAAETLEREYLVKIPGILRRYGHSQETVDDVCQKLREKLILHSHISTYTGEGKLGSWVEVIAKRMANREARPGAAESSGMSQLVEKQASSSDIEKDVVKKHLLAELQAALREAGSALSGEQRQLLKFHYRNGLSESKLAELFRTSQPTISRRLKGAREAIFEETRRRLRQRLGLSENDFDSLIADVQSRWLDLSLSQIM